MLICLMIVLIKVFEPEGDGISRAQAYKAVALALVTREECEDSLKETDTSHFEKNEWYAKYIEYLYGHQVLQPDQAESSSEFMEDFLTYGDLEAMVLNGEKVSSWTGFGDKKPEKKVTEEEWWSCYSVILKKLDAADAVEEITVQIYGTPHNIPDAPQWAAYTDQGDFTSEGLDLSTYLDQQVKVLVRGSELITVTSLVSDSVLYENVWLKAGDEHTFIAEIGSIEREFTWRASLGKMSNLVNNVADLQLSSGKLEKIVLKKDRITGKVLSVQSDYIEIEGYGELPLGPNFKVLKTYGEFEEQTISDILVGYDVQEFVVARGKICAALTVRAFDAQTIRILLMDTGFKSIFHDSVTLICDGDMVMTSDNHRETIPAGEKLKITLDDDRLKDGRLILEPKSRKDEIQIPSIGRAQGTPSYAGRIELKKEEDGFLIVNELDLEDYLTRVVPSEMPNSYEKEALKAQAVCARTYAYIQISRNGYSKYGAHVDDSTAFQVYNNIEPDEKTTEAVNETYGRMLLYDGEPIEAYYFSTSCGTTTDGSIWGGDPSKVPYLQSVALKDSREMLNLTTNEKFREFIRKKDVKSYDSAFPFFRWEVTVTNRVLNDQISGVGNILKLSVVERGPGGIVKQLRVEGSDGTKTITGSDSVRAALCNSSLTIKKQDGTTVTGWSSLPSSYIDIGVDGVDENNVITFHIYGGGYGHGAGMSQNGAQGMAKDGKSYAEILDFFYHGAQIRTIGE